MVASPAMRIILLLSVLCAASATAADRPNIIFLLSDDQRDNTFAAMGHPFVKTPSIDALIHRSMRFTNAYIAEPVCAPSRVSYLTGMHERVHGVGFTSSYQMTKEQWKRSYPALLRKAGYHTGFIGKFGVQYYDFDATAQFDYWWGHDGWTKFFPKNYTQASCTPYHRAKGTIITEIMAESMAEFLEQAPEDEPFCLSVSFNVPHGSQVTSMFDGYKGWHSMTRPANENDALKDHPVFDSLYRDISIVLPEETATDPYQFIPKRIMDQDKGRRTQTYTYDYTIPTALEHHIRYYQAITGLDLAIGQLLADLKRRGLDSNTIIIFASDHGLLMGEHGMGGKSLLYDLASKIPCFIHDPNGASGACNLLVSSIDITKTILDYADVPAEPFMDGFSLKPLVKGISHQPWRSDLFLESLYTGRDTPFQEGIRDGNWKYIRMFDAPGRYTDHDVDFAGRSPNFEMLFDLKNDPGERINLIETMAESDVLARLRERTATQSESINRRRAAFKDTVTVKDR